MHGISKQVNGRLEGIIAYDSSGKVVEREYHYDSRGRVQDLRDFYEFNLLLSDKYTSKSYAYDRFDNVTDISMRNSDSPGITKERYSYEYDKKGQIVDQATINNYPGVANRINETKTYTYDFMDRLTEEITNSDGTTTQKSYTYDKIGNRLSETVDSQEMLYEYDEMGYNRLMEITDGNNNPISAYTYDPHGNQVGEANSVSGETVSNAYDAQNRLSSTVKKDNAGNALLSTANLYNGDGQRIKKTVTSGTALEVDNYYYQNGTVAYTTDDEGKKKSLNVIGDKSNIISTRRFDDGEYYLYNKDIRGSVMTVLDDEGSFVGKFHTTFTLPV